MSTDLRLASSSHPTMSVSSSKRKRFTSPVPDTLSSPLFYPRHSPQNSSTPNTSVTSAASSPFVSGYSSSSITANSPFVSSFTSMASPVVPGFTLASNDEGAVSPQRSSSPLPSPITLRVPATPGRRRRMKSLSLCSLSLKESNGADMDQSEPAPAVEDAVLNIPARVRATLINPYLPMDHRRSYFPRADTPELSTSRYRTEFEHIIELDQEVGTFGFIYLVFHRLTGCRYVVKKIRKPLPVGFTDSESCLREIQILASLPTNTNIVRYFSSWVEESHLYIQMEYCELGNLKLFLKTELALMFSHPSGYVELLRQIMSGLSCLEDMGIVHLDINLVNIFVTKNAKSEIIFKIGDFGCARKANSVCFDFDSGTGAFAAPETVQTEEEYIPNMSADIFSTGVTLIHSILHSNSKWILSLTHDRTADLLWHSLEYIQAHDKASPLFVQLLRLMTSPVPEQRPSIRFVQAHLEKCA